MIWVKREEEYFCNQDWTGQIRLNCFNKSAVSRKIGAKRRPMTGSVRVRIHSGYGFRASAPRAARMTGADAGSFVIVRDDGNPAPAGFHSESQASAFILARIAEGTVVDADEAGSWDNLDERFEVRRIKHQDAYSLDGARTNWTEE